MGDINFINPEFEKKREYVSYQLEGYNELISDLIKHINLANGMSEQLTMARNGNVSAKATIKDYIENYLNNREFVTHRFSPSDINKMAEEILYEVIGYGPMDELYFKIKKQDVFCNSYFDIQYQGTDNETYETDIRFKNEQHFESFINRLLDSVNEKLDLIHPDVDTTLPDGTRMSATHKSVSGGYTTATFRFHPKTLYTLDEYVDYKVIDEKMKRLFSLTIKYGISPMVYGATGSGKTSLIGALMKEASRLRRRFILISDTDEHFFKDKEPRADMVTLISRSKGKSIFTLADCVKKALRYRPKLIFFNELRDSSIFHYLDAISTGHPGASGVHGESVEKMINRVITLIKEYNSTFSDTFCAEKLDSAIDMFVEMSEHGDSKKVWKIYLLDGFSGTTPILSEMFRYEQNTDTFIFNHVMNDKLRAKLKKANVTDDEFFAMIEG